MVKWYLYMIRCGDGTLYAGISTDVPRRFAEHQRNSSRSAKYLRGRGPLVLVLKRCIGINKHVALSVERTIKNLRRAHKEMILTRADIVDRIADHVERRGDGTHDCYIQSTLPWHVL